MAVLIAGCGYVGSVLARELVARGEEVYGIRRTASKIPEGVGAIGVDLGDRDAVFDSVGPIASKIQHLVYAASADERSEEAYHRAYVHGLDHVLDALASAPLDRALFTASTAVYGQTEGWVDESSPTEPRSFTGKILLEGEARLHEASCETVSLRLAGIYGPGRTRLVSKVHQGTLGGDRWTNRIHRDDCAGALAYLLGVEAPEPAYVGVDDAPVALSEVATFIAGQLGVEPPAFDAPPSGKRCRNALLTRGYVLRRPSYRDGYPEIVRAYRTAAADA